MQNEVRVLIVEDDIYARDLMALLLTRDWRTQVVAEHGSHESLVETLQTPDHRIDVVIMDTEVPGEVEWPSLSAAWINQLPKIPAVLFTGTQADLSVIQQMVQIERAGYILKGEIQYALASAVSRVHKGDYIITPGICLIAPKRILPGKTVVIDGRRRLADFTPREAELVRLGIIFHLALRDIADELVISSGWVSEVISTIYKKLGMQELLTGEVPLEEVFEDETVLAHCREIARRAVTSQPDGRIRKAPWMATLAFHLLTVPDIYDL